MATPPTRKSIKHEYVQTAIRIPSDLHAEIKAAASLSGNPMKSEIIARLQAASVNQQIATLRQDIAEIKGMLRELLSK